MGSGYPQPPTAVPSSSIFFIHRFPRPDTRERKIHNNPPPDHQGTHTRTHSSKLSISPPLMAFLALSTPSPWPRMRSDRENPFQNAPGPFIYALPNLGGSCPSSSFSDVIADGSLAGYAAPDHDHDQYQYQYQYQDHCYHQLPSDPAEPLPEQANLDLFPVLPQSPDLDEDANASDETKSCLSEGEADPRGEQQQHQQPRSGTSTPAPSQAPSSAVDSSEYSEEIEKGGEGERRRTRKRGGGRRRRGRAAVEHGGCVMGPRAMGIHGVQYHQWTRYPWSPGRTMAS
ncbi:hypothetical protein BC826DRAFT_229718 [Russula brevipes]|nr:hypothetical protein BC826DRAFT_229718 [Russula brevipes]